MTYANHVADLERFVADHRLNRVAVVGHSMARRPPLQPSEARRTV